VPNRQGVFRFHSDERQGYYRFIVIGLLVLSVTALAITIWELTDFVREQEVVEDLIRSLPDEQTQTAKSLAGELRLQFRLMILVLLNVVVTGVAVGLLWRAYSFSQDSLRDFKVLAADILGSIDQGVVTTDQQGTITGINRRAFEMLETDLDCIGQHLSSLSNQAELDLFRTDWIIGKDLALTRDFDTQFNGSHRVLRAACQTLNDLDGKGIGFVIQLSDVTRRLLIEDRMRRMERYMGLGSLAAGLHHEIKNPLAALSLHVQLLEEQVEDDDVPDELRQCLSVIQMEVARIGRVLEGFRDFAAIDELDLNPINLKDLIRRQIELISPQAKRQRVSVEYNLPDDLPTETFGDQVRLEQVLLNIFLNALEAMPEGGRIAVSATTEDEMVIVHVSDTGPGIPEDLRDKIFDPYFTTKTNGTGLGLSLCDKMVSQHNGRLELDSSRHGTTFRMLLPLASNSNANCE